ncbi:MAG: CRISPR system precrRNA processing endoribonuclease RAMP protein Cas6 [Oscillochloris sp.]|nr:CRISPR system precrRNA processing endoribonuclease RAMP protein Cas6 [Oscillochloris sp.]
MLTTHYLEFTAVVLTPVALDAQAGAQVRGALVEALWGRFCANQAAPSCGACPLLRICPVATLVAPMREEGETGGEQRPRPYVIRPPAAPCDYRPGATLRFQLGLFGPAAQLFPYVVMAAQGLAQGGIGRRLPEYGGRRGTLRLDEIAAIHPLSAARQTLYRHAMPQVQAPGLPITADTVAAAAVGLPTDQVTLQLHSPLRLIERGQLVRRFALRPFVLRLKERLDQLVTAYGDGPPLPRLEVDALIEHVHITTDATRWADLVNYSSRQRRGLPLGGLVGAVTLAGDLPLLLRELLVWGSLVHVGKNCVKGDGWYTLT